MRFSHIGLFVIDIIDMAHMVDFHGRSERTGFRPMARWRQEVAAHQPS